MVKLTQNCQKNARQLKAFTFLEIVLVVAIFTATVFLLLPMTISQLQGVRAEHITKDIKSAIFAQQQSAYARQNNIPYGIALYDRYYILFTGADIATATTQDRYDLTSDIVIRNITLTSGNQIIFPSGSQKPSVTGRFDVTQAGASYRININSEGLLTIDKL